MSDSWNAVNEAIARFGIPSDVSDRQEIIARLQRELELEENEEGDQLLMRALCAQLFSIGVVDDVLLIWEAKSCSFDTMLDIDTQFLCGAGLEETKKFLESQGTEDALDALNYIIECEENEAFAEFSIEGTLSQIIKFYGGK